MKAKNVLKNLLAVIGIALTVNGIAMFFVATFNLGNLLTVILGVVLSVWGIWYDKISKAIPRWIRFLVALLIAAAVCVSSFLLIYGNHDSASYKEDAVIVLGAGVNGSRVSLSLADRLDAAVDYYEENPKALIVVSGGKGPQEDISEASAMEQYLVERGVPKEAIIKEDKSTSTYENFKFSKALLDGKFDGEYSAAYITNDYHIYRALGIAKNAGVDRLTHIHSDTRWHTVIPGVLRECLAVAKFWVFGN